MKPSTQGTGRRWLDRLPRTWLELGKVFGGLFARNILRGLFKLLLAAFMSPSAMGIYRSTLSFYRILNSLVDLGLSHAVTVFVPPAIRRKDAGERDRILMSVTVMLSVILALLLVVGLLLAELLATLVLSDPGLVGYVRLAVLAVGGRLFWRFFQHNLAAHQHFGRLALYLTTIPVLMIVAGVALALAGRLTITSALLITLFAPLATVLLWLPGLDVAFVRMSNWSAPVAREMLRFSRWVYLTNIASSMRSHLNPLLLKSPGLSGTIAAGEASAGLYGFGNDLANELQMFSGAVITVLTPKAARRSGPAELRGYVKRAYRGLLILLVPLAPLFLLAEPALRLLGLLNENYLEYMPSLEVFTILYIGGLFSIASIPMQTALYAMRMPHIETRLEAAMLPVLVIGGVLLIPRFGPNGAALAILAQRVISFVVIGLYGFLKLWRWSGPEDGPE